MKKRIPQHTFLFCLLLQRHQNAVIFVAVAVVVGVNMLEQIAPCSSRRRCRYTEGKGAQR
jgi:hypothetical protein